MPQQEWVVKREVQGIEFMKETSHTGGDGRCWRERRSQRRVGHSRSKFNQKIFVVRLQKQIRTNRVVERKVPYGTQKILKFFWNTPNDAHNLSRGSSIMHRSLFKFCSSEFKFNSKFKLNSSGVFESQELLNWRSSRVLCSPSEVCHFTNSGLCKPENGEKAWKSLKATSQKS